MGIQPGTRIGPYEVGAIIGSGGMGEVFRATDTTLVREVAIKALPRSFATDAGRIARFEQEAKVLAALNHPNIAQIYGLDRSGESAVIVMELVDGPTLADRVARGPIPADDALAIAMQIAAALEAAHDKGIVHRDLKPANIKLRADGTVKVLDFGIAKAFDPRSLTSGPQSPVMTTPVTQAGVILGTAAYMSPEQARGKPVDQRTDIWAFGCVLFEMLTGQPIFAGEDVSITLARVLERDTNLDSMPSAITPAVKHTIAMCLRKDPRKRFHSIADVRLALAGELLPDIAGAGPNGAQVREVPFWRRGLPMGAGLVLGSIIAGAVVYTLQGERAARSVTRFSEAIDVVQNLPILAIADDGERIAYTEGTPLRLMVRELNEYEARPLPDVIVGPGAITDLGALCFSPDGDWLAHYSGNGSELRKTPILGGRGQPLATGLSASAGSCDWAEDGYVYFGGNGLARVPETGGAVEWLIEPDPNANTLQVSPQLLPGGTLLAYSISTRSNLLEATSIGVLDLETMQTKVVLEDVGLAQFMPAGTSPGSGYFVYAQDGAIFVARFDGERRVANQPQPLIEAAMGVGSLGFVAVSASGTLAYVDGNLVFPSSTLSRVDRSGNLQGTIGTERVWGEVSLSPNDSYAVSGVLEVDTFTADLWGLDLAGGRPSKLNLTGVNGSVVWMPPDGERMLYVNYPSLTVASSSLRTMATDGSVAPTTIAEFDSLAVYPTSISPDAAALIGSARSTPGRGAADVWVIALDELMSRDTPETGLDIEYLLRTESNESHATFSPDGRWIAYASDEAGTSQIYIIPFPYPGPGSKRPVSIDGGRQPRWNPAGGELFYLNGTSMMSVTIESSGGFRANTPVELFEHAALLESGSANSQAFQYDVTSDGQTFLLLSSTADSAEPPELRVIVNWSEELNRQ